MTLKNKTATPEKFTEKLTTEACSDATLLAAVAAQELGNPPARLRSRRYIAYLAGAQAAFLFYLSLFFLNCLHLSETELALLVVGGKSMLLSMTAPSVRRKGQGARLGD